MRNILCLFFKFGALAYKRALISLWKKEKKNLQKVFCQISEFVIIVSQLEIIAILLYPITVYFHFFFLRNKTAEDIDQSQS